MGEKMGGEKRVPNIRPLRNHVNYIALKFPMKCPGYSLSGEQ
jgi:hypothetical protein